MDFKEYTVEELVNNNMLEKPIDGNHGNKHPKSSDYVKKGIPFIMVSDIDNGKINYNTCKFITEYQKNNLDKGFSKPGDILLSHKATIGVTCIVDNSYTEIVITPQLTYYRVKNGINKYYLKYYFDSPYFQNILKNWATSGSTRAYLGITAQLKLPILLPELEIQDKIAKILSVIDRKIEINNQTNDNLLEISRMDFEKLYQNNKLWNECRIDDLNLYISDYVANGSFKSLSENVRLYDEKEYALFIRNTDLKVNFTQERKYVDKHSYDFLKKSQLFGRELIISNVGDVGSIFLCPSYKFPMSLGNNVIMVDSKNLEINYNYYLYYFFKSNQGQHLIDGITGGSAQPKFNKTDFRASRIRIPSKDELEAFNKKVIPMYNKIELNIFENETLAQLRDTLLPKLMNGEIDLDKIEI